KVVLDSNGDHSIDPSDVGLGGIEVDLLDANGIFITSTTTAADGTFSFTGLATGTYSIVVVPPTNAVYGSMYPSMGSSGGMVNLSWSGTTNIQLNAGDAADNYIFGLYPSGT